MKTDRLTPPRRAPWRAFAMTARCLTALVGGYAAASGLASLLARSLPIARVEATAWGMILSFLIYALLALWAFHESRLLRVAAVIWGSALLSVALLWLMGPRP
jgi:hypothetical protein